MEVHEDEDELNAWCLLEESRERAMARGHEQEIKIEVEETCPRVIAKC